MKLCFEVFRISDALHYQAVVRAVSVRLKKFCEILRYHRL